MDHSILAIAVASCKLGFVYLEGDKLCDWGTSVKATKSTTEIAGFVQGKIIELQPTVVVTEKCAASSRKGSHARSLIGAVAETASHNSVLDVSSKRSQRFANKFEEAANLAKQYPELAGHLPVHNRRSFDNEPRSLIMFEALALAIEVSTGGSTRMAAAMG